MKQSLLVSFVLTLLVGCASTNGRTGRLERASQSTDLPPPTRDFLSRLAGNYYLDTGGGSYDEYTIHPDSTFTETEYNAPFFGSPAQTSTRSGPVRVLSEPHFELVFKVGSLEFAAGPDFASITEDNGTKYARR